MRRPAALLVAAMMTLNSCTRDGDDPRSDPGAPPPTAEATTAAARDAELVAGGERVIRFLQGDTPFDDFQMADTVTLRLSPEGGGARAPLPREALHDRENWAVPAC